jgi:hypothetical protein
VGAEVLHIILVQQVIEADFRPVLHARRARRFLALEHFTGACGLLPAFGNRAKKTLPGQGQHWEDRKVGGHCDL